MGYAPGLWHTLLAGFALSVLLAAFHVNEIQTAFQKAVAYAQGGAVDPSLDTIGASARGSEAKAAEELSASFAVTGGAGWARWFGTGDATDDAFDEDAIRLLLKEAEVLEDQWRFQPAEKKLHEAFQRVTGWQADLKTDRKPRPQRDRATRQAVDVLLHLGRFLEDRGSAAKALPSFRLAADLVSTLTLPVGSVVPSLGKVNTNAEGFMADFEEEHDAEALGAQVASQAGLARALCHAGGQHGAAVKEARVLFSAALGHRPGPPAQLEAQVHADFAECLHREGALAEARAGLAAARRLLEKASLDSSWPATERAALERRLVRLQGGVSHDGGAFADAVTFYGEYLQKVPRTEGGLPALVEVLQRFEVMQDLALAQASLGKVEDSFSTMDDVDRLQKASGDELLLKSHQDDGVIAKFLGPNVLDNRLQASVARSRLVRCELALERSRVQRRRPAESTRQLAMEAVALLRGASASAEDLENALNTLGNVQMSLGEASNAQEAYREALKLAVQDHGENSPLVAALYHNVASALELTGKLSEAVKLYTAGLNIQLATLGEANPDTAGSLDSLARCLSKTGLRADALDAALRAAKAARAAYPEGHWLRRETEARLKKLRPPITMPSSQEFLVAQEVHRVADA